MVDAIYSFTGLTAQTDTNQLVPMTACVLLVVFTTVVIDITLRLFRKVIR